MSDARAPDYDDKQDEADVPPPKDKSGRITPVLEPNEARQGATHHGVRYVLGLSLGLVVIGFIAAYFLFFPTTDPMPPEQVTTPDAAGAAPPPEPTTVP